MSRFLVVDDELSIRAMFARVLSAQGAVDQAGGGAEALELLSQNLYDVVVLDLMMPEVDGFAVLERLASPTEKNHATPIIVVTARPKDQALVQSFRSGALLFLSKPVHLQQLVAMVALALAQRRPPAATKKR